MDASVRRSSAQAARLSRRSVYMSAAPADASAMAVVTSMTTMSFPERLRRALAIESKERQGRRGSLKTLPFELVDTAASCLHFGNTFHCLGLCPTRTSLRSTRKLLTRAVLLVVLATLTVAATPAQFSADAVKAAYLYRFAQYVEWPQPLPPDGAFVIGISGAENVAVHLERLQPGLSVNGRPVKVVRVSRVQDLDGVQLLFTGDSA